VPADSILEGVARLARTLMKREPRAEAVAIPTI
jgi:hypothetical protein